MRVPPENPRRMDAIVPTVCAGLAAVGVVVTWAVGADLVVVLIVAALALWYAVSAAYRWRLYRRHEAANPPAPVAEPSARAAVTPSEWRRTFAATGAFPDDFDWPAVDVLYALDDGTDAVDYLSAISEHAAGARVDANGAIAFTEPAELDRFAVLSLDVEASAQTYRDVLDTLRRLAHPVPLSEPAFEPLAKGKARLAFTCAGRPFGAPVDLTGKSLDPTVPEHVATAVSAASDEPLGIVPVDAAIYALRFAPGRAGPFARETNLPAVGPRA